MPTFDAGSIEAKLKLDRSDFNRELRAAKRDAAEFERDDITKKLKADTRDFDKATDKVRKDAKKLDQEKSEIEVRGDTSDWEKDFRKTLAEAEELARRTTDVKIDANVRTLRAQSQVAELDAELDALGRKVVEPEIRIDEGGVLTRRVGILATALIGLSPAAIPAITGITAATLGLSAALAGATGAVGIFGVGLIASIAPALKLNEELNKLNEKLEQTEDVAKRAEIIKQIGEITKQMTPEVQEFVDSLTDLGKAWETFGSEAGSSALPVASRAIQILSDAIEPLPGVIRELAPAFHGWLAGIEDFIHGPGYREFLGFIMTEGPPALDNLGRLIGNLATGVGGLLRSFTPFGQNFLRVITEGSERFATWGQQLGATSGFQRFIDYVNETGPQLVDTLGAIIDAVIDVGQALAPLGGPTLAIIRIFAESLSLIADVAPGLIPLALGMYTVARAAAAFGDAVQATRQKVDNFVASTGKAPAGVSRFRAALSGVSGIVGGPWGLAITAGITALGLFASKHAEAKARSDALKQSLDQTTGAITNEARAQIAQNLAQNDAVKLGRELKVNYADIQGAAEGNAQSTRRLRAQIDNTLGSLKSQRDAAKENSVEWYELNDAYGAAYLASRKLYQLIGTSAGPIAEQRDVIKDTQTLMGGYIDTTSGLRFATEGEARAHADAGREIREQRDALAGLVAQQKASREEALRLASAEINYEQALDDAQAAAAKNGETHDITTQKGRDNERMLIALADAQQKLTDDSKFLTLSAQDQIAVLEDQRRQFIAVAQDMGYSKTQAAALADEYLKLPTEVTTKAKLDAEEQKLNDWKTGLDDVKTQIKTVTELVLDAAGIQSWDEDLDGIPDSVDTKTKIDPDKPGLSLWNELLNDLPEEKKTDGSIRADYGGLRRWQASIDAVHGKTVTLRTNREIYTYRFDSTQARRGAQPGGERGGVFGVDIDGIPAFALGGMVDMRAGGVQPGFSAKDNRIGLFRDGEGVLIPEAVELIGGARAVNDLNQSARMSIEPESELEQVRGRFGTAVTIEQMNIINPTGTPTEDTIMDRVTDLNVMFS